MKAIRRNYFVLIVLGLVFAAPGITAYFFYTHPEWLGAAPTNKGVFLDPPVLLEPLSNSAKWRLVLWSPEACDTSCMKQLDKLARIRLALGRRLYQVAPQLLLGAKAPSLTTEQQQVLKEQDIVALKLPAGIHVPALQNRLEVFIVNPENYLVLAYLPTVNPADIFHDIKQLLSTTEKTGK